MSSLIILTKTICLCTNAPQDQPSVKAYQQAKPRKRAEAAWFLEGQSQAQTMPYTFELNQEIAWSGLRKSMLNGQNTQNTSPEDSKHGEF